MKRAAATNAAVASPARRPRRQALIRSGVALAAALAPLSLAHFDLPEDARTTLAPAGEKPRPFKLVTGLHDAALFTVVRRPVCIEVLP